MRQPHLFTKFQPHVAEPVRIVAEKNTKKELERILEETKNACLTSGTRKVSTVILDLEKLGLDKWGTIIGQMSQRLAFPEHGVILVEHSKLAGIEDDVSSEDLKAFYKLSTTGKERMFKTISEHELLVLMNHFNRKGRQVIDRLTEAHDEYAAHLERIEGKPFVALERDHKYNFKTFQINLFSLYRDCFDMNARILTPFSSVNPDISFQRDLVWPLDKQVDFIDSILNDIPIGVFYVNDNIHDIELGEGFGRILWDGRQRMYAIHNFVSDVFPVTIGGQDVYFSQNPVFFKNFLTGTMISIYESYFTDMDDIIRAYVSINKKQVNHTVEDIEKALLLIKSN